MSLSYTEREYAYIRELERVRSQNNMNLMIIQKLTMERQQESSDEISQLNTSEPATK